ncbi:hypothetical protein VP01_2365g3 [Puccinia sorghi]|uniref:Uncharacterized protein n=1 Tax=Puccinia sorghi TaxID=27349 RepID=A0A0L6V918_9BASI|nr:hypothetical protein VP01_2365g3 [Puccinia sorghi]
MIRPGFITLAVCLLFGKFASVYAFNSLAKPHLSPLPADSRTDKVQWISRRDLKAAPLGRRNLPAFGMLHHEHGMHGSPHGQDSYDPQQAGYNSAKETSPSGNGKHDWGKGTYDLGTGTHHTLQEGNLYSGDGAYNKGSDPETEDSPKPNAPDNYGSEMSDYSPDYQDPNTKDNGYVSPGKSYDFDRRNMPASLMSHHEHGMHGSSHGQDSYDPQQGGYNSGKGTSPSGSGKYNWGKGTHDSGTGTHHSLPGNLYSGDGGYNKGSDPETKSSPKPNASGNYGSQMSDYSPEYQDPNTKDNGYVSPSKSYDSDKGNSQDPSGSTAGTSEYQQDPEEKSPQSYNKPPPEDKSEIPGEKNYNKKPEDPQNSGKGKQSGGYQNDKGSDDNGSFVFEKGTTEEQRKAAQDDAKKNEGLKKGDSHGGESKPSTYSSNQGESQPDNASGQTNGDSPYA